MKNAIDTRKSAVRPVGRNAIKAIRGQGKGDATARLLAD